MTTQTPIVYVDEPDTELSPAMLEAFKMLDRIPVCACCQLIEVDEIGDLCLDCHTHNAELVEALKRALPLLDSHADLYGYSGVEYATAAGNLAAHIRKLLDNPGDTDDNPIQ